MEGDVEAVLHIDGTEKLDETSDEEDFATARETQADDMPRQFLAEIIDLSKKLPWHVIRLRENME